MVSVTPCQRAAEAPLTHYRVIQRCIKPFLAALACLLISTAANALTVYTAKKIITMEPALPEATAVAVEDGLIVGVGSLESLQPWLDARSGTIDRSLENLVLMPGFIDPHVHPALPAVITQFPFLAPDDWTLPTGNFPGARNPQAYEAQLKILVAAHEDEKVPFITWGYHQLWHGDIDRTVLNRWFPNQAVMLWHRSFHEMVANDSALAMLGLTQEDTEGHHEVDWEAGKFWENGMHLLTPRMAFILAPERFGAGMKNFLEMMHQGGVTTALDMGTGVFGDPVAEIELVRAVAESSRAPSRVILTPIITDFLARKKTPEEALQEIEGWRAANSHRVMIDRHFKLMMDGAIFSGLSQMGPPGYLDGHDGQWMAPLAITGEWAEFFWRAGYKLHAHTNGDKSAAAVIDMLRDLQSNHPRPDHRFTVEHFAYSTEDQTRQLKALGAAVSANPYYHYILSDIYSEQWLGPDRGSQMVRLGSLERAGVPFALHSDSPMAPLSPLTLAYNATNRVTINGNATGRNERISLDSALRAITIDAAWIMGWEDRIGSIRAGKKADFTVLERSPYDVGAENLRDINIWGTVFEGELHPLEPH